MTAPSFDQPAWLNRIGYAGSLEPTLSTLHQLIFAHSHAIAYESLDIMLGRTPKLDLASLQRKMISGGRGGYCLEQNMLFREGLRSLGYNMTSLQGRVVRGMAIDAPRPAIHMLLQVDMPEGKYLADVGFGNLAPTSALLLRPGIEQETPHEVMRSIDVGGELTLQAKLRDSWEHIYRVIPYPRYDGEYEIANWYTGTHPDAPYPMGAARLHLALEAARLAFGVRDTHIADPAYMREPVAGLLDKRFARKLAKLLDPGKRVALPKSPAPSSDTIYLTVVDRNRAAVSLINSLYTGFGTGICTEKTGVMLHNRGRGFVVEPNHPNTIAPGKRPMHTIIPAIAISDGRCTMSFGVMGANFQPMGHAHIVTNMVDYGMDIQQAIDAPRVFYMDEVTEVERGVPEASIAGLKSRGHNVVLRRLPHGGGQGIVIDWEKGNLIGGSDPRKDGCAIGY